MLIPPTCAGRTWTRPPYKSDTRPPSPDTQRTSSAPATDRFPVRCAGDALLDTFRPPIILVCSSLASSFCIHSSILHPSHHLPHPLSDTMTVPSFEGKTTQKAAVCHGAVDLRIVSELWTVESALADVGLPPETPGRELLPLSPRPWCTRPRKHVADRRQEDKPIRAPAEGEAQVAMGVTGLCGSDRE